MGTFFSIILAAFLILTQSSLELAPSIGNLSLVFSAVGIFFILAVIIMNAFVLSPLQKAEEQLTPRVVELYKNDKWIMYSNLGMLFFSIISFIFAYNPSIFHQLNQNILFSIWLILLGFSCDIIYLFQRGMLNYFNPFAVVKMFRAQAKTSIQTEHDNELCQWIDALTEISTKAIDRQATSLCNESLNEIQLIAKQFMESCKSISHLSSSSEPDQPKKDNEEALGRDADEVSYILFYIYERLEFINKKAVRLHLESVCSKIISVLSRIIIYSAKFDLSLAGYPVHYMGKITEQALAEGLNEVGVKASLTLLEVSKTILREADYTYGDLKDPFINIVNNLDEIAKMTFKKDKTTSIAVLKQPFIELKSLFSDEKLAVHQDTPVIMANINRVLGEFDALEMVLRTMPAIPIPSETEIETETETGKATESEVKTET